MDTEDFWIKLYLELPWLVWLSGLSAGLRTKGSSVQLPVRARQLPSRGAQEATTHCCFSPSLPSPLSKNK